MKLSMSEKKNFEMMYMKVMKYEYDCICHIGSYYKMPLLAFQKVTFDFELNFENQLYINTHTVL